MGSFNFKSSGQTQEQKLIETLTVSKTPIGIKTPLQISDGENTEILVTYDNLADTVNDNLRNLLLTNWGERVGLYDFGANLRPLMCGEERLLAGPQEDGELPLAGLNRDSRNGEVG